MSNYVYTPIFWDSHSFYFSVKYKIIDPEVKKILFKKKEKRFHGFVLLLYGCFSSGLFLSKS